MQRISSVLFMVGAALSLAVWGIPAAAMETGTSSFESMSALAFSPDGVLFIADAKAGRVVAVDLKDNEPRGNDESLSVPDVETKIAARLGLRPDDVMIHDMAVNPASQNVYMIVSRGRGKWRSGWSRPNELEDADILLRIAPDRSVEYVSLKDVPHAAVALRDPIDPAKEHRWKRGVKLRTDAITDMAFHDGQLYVSGLSNLEFASTMWKVPFPFQASSAATTLEIFHGAHGEFETHAPIRTFVPYRLSGKNHLLAAYLCTPFVTFDVDSLEDGQHVKGRTVAEFGSGNYPLDMVVYEKNGKERLLMANSALPLMIIKPEDVAGFEGQITEKTSEYHEGIPFEVRTGTGIQQMDRLNANHVLLLQRSAGGQLHLVSKHVSNL